MRGILAPFFLLKFRYPASFPSARLSVLALLFFALSASSLAQTMLDQPVNLTLEDSTTLGTLIERLNQQIDGTVYCPLAYLNLKTK